MILSRLLNASLFVGCMALLVACGQSETKLDPNVGTVASGRESKGAARVQDGGSLFDIFKGGVGEVKVNRFLWTASLEVLNFLPVQSADPFTGIITTGYGRPPGGGRAYRATILISDPALDARSLNVALQTSGGGAVSAGTQRAVEDAILNRARQLRIQAGKF
ncbi:MAG: DUF3576 domain-containing protein [Roseovarius sp.]|nr:DUF3576 domain-containing protein [Roseovarius sp.]